MGRLTKINEDACQLCKADYCTEKETCFLYEVYEKLGDYEDLEEQLMKSAEIDIDSMVGEFMHYYNLQKENRLIELPCAVGDTVYVIEEGYKDALLPSTLYYYIEENPFDVWLLHAVGKWVFLTKEEAEAKLKELEGVKE